MDRTHQKVGPDFKDVTSRDRDRDNALAAAEPPRESSSVCVLLVSVARIALRSRRVSSSMLSLVALWSAAAPPPSCKRARAWHRRVPLHPPAY